MTVPVLYSYWRSSCSWRVRIALNLKEIDFEVKPVHLVQDGGHQHSQWYRELNPLRQVPTLIWTDGTRLTQSLAIMQFLDQIKPPTSLLPDDPIHSAKVLQYSEMINSGIQPLQNLAVLQFLNQIDSTKLMSKKWGRTAIENGLQAIEHDFEDSTPFLSGDKPGLADCCLIPQLYNARRFNCDLSKFSSLLKVEERCSGFEAFHKSHPDQQVDAG